jgi:hypothetical protein
MFLIAGILGVLALFQPMIKIGRGPLTIEASAYDLTFGFRRTHVALDMRIPTIAAKHIPADVLQTRDDIKLVADASKHAALAYVPAALLLLLGILTVKLKKTPRVLAIVAGVMGLLSAAAYFGIRYGIAYGIEEEPALARLNFRAVFGAQVLLAVGILAVLGTLKSFSRSDA